MFGHTVGGYNTTSSLFLVGKGLSMKKLNESPLFRNHAKVFTKKSNSQEKNHRGRGKRLLFCSVPVVWMTQLEHALTWQVDTKTIHLHIGKGTLQVASKLIYSKMSLFANVVLDTAVDLLHAVKFNCKTDSHSAKCSYRKQGFICTVGCG